MTEASRPEHGSDYSGFYCCVNEATTASLTWLLPQSPLTCVFPLLTLPPLLPSVAATGECMSSPYGSGGRPLHSVS